MKIMARHVSATQREETPHTINSTTTKTLNLNGAAGNIVSSALKRRAQSLINNTSIDGTTRTIIRYALEIKDASLSELVRRIDAGEAILDDTNLLLTGETAEGDWRQKKIEALSEIICRPGDEPETKSAALLVLMGTLENCAHPKALANAVKHIAFGCCGQLNADRMVDAQIAILENKLVPTMH
jgi:hypothetical protein